MTAIRYFLLLLCCAFFLCPVLSAQEEGGITEADLAELGPRNKAFLDTYTEYRTLAKKLTAMKVEYQDAAPARRTAIDAEYHPLYKKGLELHKKSVSLALDAHDETPNNNQLVVNLLYSTVVWEFNSENYEESVRVFKRLAASGLIKESEQFYVFAGLSAMLSMNYDEAEVWLKAAEESGELRKKFTEWLQSPKAEINARILQTILMAMPQTKEAWAKEQEIRKAETAAGEQDPAKKLPRVELTTKKGKIVLELFENEAPNTVANFISLVEKKFYDGVVFHRVLPNFMAQGGDPTGSGRGGPGYAFDDECGNRFPQYRKHFRGSISMANGGPNTNGSQFFLTFVPTVMLDGKHTVFGRIVEGLEVLSEIQRVDPDDQEAKIPELDKIIEAKVLNKRDHVYEVKKNGGR